MPGQLQATGGSGQIALAWGAASDNVGVTDYRVERCTGAGCTNFAEIATATVTNYTNGGLAAQSTYTYRVRAEDAAGNLGPYSNTASATTGQVTIPSGLVAAYDFNEGAGSTAADGSGHGNTGSVVGATWVTAGQYGGALQFNGVNTSVTVNPLSGETAGPVTITFWAKPASVTNNQYVGQGYDGGGLGNTRAVVLGYQDGFWNIFNNGYPTGLASDTQMAATAGVWQHVAYTWDGTVIRGYVNGVQHVNVTAGFAPSIGNVSTRRFGTSGSNDYYAGVLDEVRIYGRALTAGEVQADMGTAVTNPTPDTQAPGVPGQLQATGGSGQIALAWGAASDNVGVTDYRVERCAGASCTNFAQIGTATGTSYTDGGLAAQSTYTYRVRAEDAAGNLGPYSNTAGATTASPDTQAPGVPRQLQATGGSGQIALAWGAATDNVGVTDYRVERCTGAGCTNFAEIATATVMNYTNGGLAAQSTYTYRVRAEDAAGNLGPYSNTARRATTGQLTIPSGLVAAYDFDEGAGSTVADGSGHGNTGSVVGADVGDSGAVWRGAAVQWGEHQRDGESAERRDGRAGDDHVLGEAGQCHQQPVCGPGLRWRRVGQHAGGRSGYQDGFWNIFNNGYPTGLASDTQMAATAGVWQHVAYTWDGTVIRGYVNGVQHVNVTAGFAPSIGNMSTRRFGTSGSNDYYAGVLDEVRIYGRALTATEVQADMGTAVTNPTPDTQAPGVPGQLQATGGSGQIALAWGAASDNVGVTDYRVERCAGASCTNFAQIGTATGTSYTDGGLAAQSTYTYRVRAEDAAGNLGPYSNTAGATTASPDTQAPGVPGQLQATGGSGQIALAWGAATDNVGVTDYRVERCTGAGCTNFAEIATATVTNYTNGGLAAQSTYTYRVRAEDAAGNLGPYSNTAGATTGQVTIPSGLVAAYDFNEGAGSTAADGSGHGNTGSVVGATWVTAGQYGGALQFNGVNASVTVNPLSGETAGPVTITFWAKPASVTNNQYVGQGYDGAGLGNTRAVVLGYQDGFWNIFNNGYPTGLASDTQMAATAGVWQHVAYTWDGTVIRGYVNGVQHVSVTAGFAPSIGNMSTRRFGTSGSNDYYAGVLDEVRIYGRALTATEVQADMGTAVTNPTPDTQAPGVPGQLQATGGSGQIALAWGAASDNVGVTDYRVERCAGAELHELRPDRHGHGDGYTRRGFGGAIDVHVSRAGGRRGAEPWAYSNTAGATQHLRTRRHLGCLGSDRRRAGVGR